MAPKRQRNSDGRFTSSGGSQTGGTGDVKPQILTVNVSEPAGANDFAVTEQNVPRIILGAQGTATIMEMLRVDWYIGIEDIGDTTATWNAYLSTRVIRVNDAVASLAAFAVDASDPNTFANVMLHVGTATTGSHSFTLPLTVDLTDENGNGMLVATDKFFATVGGVNNTLTSIATAKILYRMVNVGITEYVGIVQSQLT